MVSIGPKDLSQFFPASCFLPSDFCVLLPSARAVCYAVLVMCRRAQWPRLVLAAALFAALATPAFAQQKDIEKAASNLEKRMHIRLLKGAPKSKVAVFVFRRADGKTSQLGLLLAAKFALALESHRKNFDVLSPEQVESIRQRELWTESDTRDEKVACAVAQEASATTLITASYEIDTRKSKRPSAQLEVTAADAFDGRRIAVINGKVSLEPDWPSLDALPLTEATGPVTQEVRKEPLPEGVFRPGVNGVSAPSCIDCPDPEFTDEARRAKYVAKVALNLTVDTNGKVRDIAIVKSARYGLSEKAMVAVSKWRFKPGTDRDGKPVPTRVLVELTFRLF